MTEVLSGKMVVQKMTPDEVEGVHALEEACFEDPWSAASIEKMAEDSHTLYLTAYLDGELAGYCSVRMVLDEGEILRIAAERSRRGRGVGSALIRSLLEETPHIRTWNLEVREHNEAALGLYEKFGFARIGRRKEYYHHPTEDAVLMQKCL